MRRHLLVALAALLACFASTMAWARTPLMRSHNDPIGVVEFKLDNGLTVVLSENHERAEVFGAVVVRAGGKDDPRDNTGMAHYLEHMLFKGTQRLGTTDYARERTELRELERLYAELAKAADKAARKRIQTKIDAAAQKAAKFAIPNELDRLLAEIGGTDVNAFTSNDLTVYHNVFPASQVETWLEIYAHRFQAPVFRLFPSELEAVYEEKNRSMDGFIIPAYLAFMRRFFPGHPYGSQPVLGTVEHLKRPSLTAMRQFYDRYYVANNMALVMAGDFDAEALAPIIETKFSGWRKGSVKRKRLGPVAPFRGRESKTVRLTPVRAAALGYRTPTQGHPDYPALMVIRGLLSNDQGSGLLDRLGDDSRVLFAQVLPIEFHDHDGLVVFYAPRVVTQTMRGAERVVRKAIGSLHTYVDPGRVAAIRRNLLKDIRVQWESNEERVLAMVDVFGRGQSWQDYLDLVTALSRVEADQVKQVAARYLAGDYLAMWSRVGFPKGVTLDKPGYQAVKPQPGAQSAFARELHPLPEVRAKPRFVSFERDLQHRTIAPDVDLTQNRNPFNDVATLEVRFGIGREAMPELERLGEYLTKAGSKRLGAKRFKERLFALATTFDAYATDEEFVLELQGPQSAVPEALELVADLLRAPAVDRKMLRRVRREAWGFERLERTQAAEVAGALWEHTLYGNRSQNRRYGRRNLRRFGTRSLLDAWDTVQDHAVRVTVVSSTDADAVVGQIRSILPLRRGLKPAHAKVHRRRRAPDHDAVFVVRRRKAVQTQIYFYVGGEPVPWQEGPRLDAFAEYFGGSMGGLVFQEVREFRALAYSAYGGISEAPLVGKAGLVYAFVGCQADKTAEAIEVVTGLLRELPRKPERMPELKSALLRGAETSGPTFRELQEQVRDWRHQGFATDPRRARVAAYPTLQFEDVEAFWRRHIADRPIIIMVVGNPKRFGMATLRKHGPVTVIPERRLYARPARNHRNRR